MKTACCLTLVITLLCGCTSLPGPPPREMAIGFPSEQHFDIHPPGPRLAKGGGLTASRCSPMIELAVLQVEGEVDALPSEKLPLGLAVIYPRELLDACITGYARVRLSIARNGVVLHAWPVGASQQGFQDAVLSKIEGYKFAPASAGGLAVACTAVCEVTFSVLEE